MILILLLIQIASVASFQNKMCFHIDSSLRQAAFGEPMRANYTIDVGCPNIVICNRTFKVAYMRRLSGYYSTGLSPIDLMLDQCCGNCKRVENKTRYTDVSDIPHQAESPVDFIFPIFGRDKTTRMYG